MKNYLTVSRNFRAVKTEQYVNTSSQPSNYSFEDFYYRIVLVLKFLLIFHAVVFSIWQWIKARRKMNINSFSNEQEIISRVKEPKECCHMYPKHKTHVKKSQISYEGMFFEYKRRRLIVVSRKFSNNALFYKHERAFLTHRDFSYKFNSIKFYLHKKCTQKSLNKAQ